jgi:Uma2 family endonuclease
MSRSPTMLDPELQQFVFDESDELTPELREALQAWLAARVISYAQFAGQPATNQRSEWVAGSVVALADASPAHVRTSAFMQTLLHTFVDVRGLGVVRAAPLRVHLPETVRSPDLAFLANQHLDQLKSTHVAGAPDLIVEVVDPATAASDRGAKFYEYEQAGVREYWLIDPRRQWAEFYVMDRLGRYQPGVAGDAGIFRSRVVAGFWLRLEWLWEPPQPITALRELNALVERDTTTLEPGRARSVGKL